MDYNEEIEGLDKIIRLIKNLKSSYKQIERKSTRYQLSSETQLASKNTTDLSYDLMCLDKQKIFTWKTLLDSSLNVSIEEKEYQLSQFHKLK